MTESGCWLYLLLVVLLNFSVHEFPHVYNEVKNTTSQDVWVTQLVKHAPLVQDPGILEWR